MKKHSSPRRGPGVSTRWFAVSLASLAISACGGTPKPAPVEVVKAPEVTAAPAAGISSAAIAQFNEGVAALGETPPAYSKASDAFGAAVKTSPDFDVARLNLALSQERLGRYADAAETLRELLRRGAVDRGLTLALGRALLLSGEVEGAITEFESVLRENPEDLQSRNNLAAAYLQKGDEKTSLRYVKEVLAVQPKNVPAIINLGLIYLRQKRLPLAQLMFSKALGFEENNARAHNNIGLAHYQADNIPAAVLAFEKAISIDPTMDEARMNLGSVFLDYLDYASALSQFQAVRARFPKHYQAMVGEANALYGTTKYEEAAKLYEESLLVNERNPEVLLRVGKIYEEQLGQAKKALPFYLRFRDVARPPPEHLIHQTIMFLEQADEAPPAAPETPAGEGGGEAAPGEGAAPSPAGEGAPTGDAPAGDAPGAPEGT